MAGLNQNKRVDFAELYETMPEYMQRRDDTSYSALRIKSEVCTYKIPNLYAALPVNVKLNSVIEIGCATGELIAHFPSSETTKKMGLDISEQNVRTAKKRYPHCSFSTADMFHAELNAEVVILSDILEHVEDDAAFLRRAAEIGDYVLINLPLEKCIQNFTRKYGPSDRSGHLRWYGWSDAVALCEKAGVDIINAHQQWAFESPYEFMRHRLNLETRGSKFSGSKVTQLLKHIFQGTARFFPSIQRSVVSSNFFACVSSKAKAHREQIQVNRCA